MRKKRKIIATTITIVLMLGLHWLTTHKIHSVRDSILYHNTINAPLIPSELMQIVSGEFKGLASDFLLLEIAAFINGAGEHMTDADWERVLLHFSQAMALDPYFRQTYQMVQSFLPWKGKAKEANALLEISKSHLVWDWYPGFFIGFNHFYFLNDYANASKYLIEASQYPNAPAMLATLGAKMSQKSGQVEAAIVFLKTMYRNPEYNENSKMLIKMRIELMEAVWSIEQAMQAYKTHFGRPIKRLEDLVESGILTALPRHSEGLKFSLQDGILHY